MTLFEAVILTANSAFAGAWLSLHRNAYEVALGCFSAAAVIVQLIARFA
jgi:hypothetical protein